MDCMNDINIILKLYENNIYIDMIYIVLYNYLKLNNKV